MKARPRWRCSLGPFVFDLTMIVVRQRALPRLRKVALGVEQDGEGVRLYAVSGCSGPSGDFHGQLIADRGWNLSRPNPVCWLLAIARYKALSARRQQPHAELNDELASTVADPADDPELVLQKKDRAELLRQSLAKLSPEHGEVIDLVYYHGKSVKEVAETIGINEATVKTRMFYARKKLAELVAMA